MTEKRYVKENFCDEYAIKKKDSIIAVVNNGSNAKRICEDYGFKCLNCPYWNQWSNYCTKWKIWSETH